MSMVEPVEFLSASRHRGSRVRTMAMPLPMTGGVAASVSAQRIQPLAAANDDRQAKQDVRDPLLGLVVSVGFSVVAWAGIALALI